MNAIYLNKNQIENLDSDMFVNSKKLIKISFSFNKLKKIKANTFNGLKYLIGIYLNNNQIENLDKKIFKGLDNLIEIELHNNRFANQVLLELNLEKSVQFISLFNDYFQNDINYII